MDLHINKLLKESLLSVYKNELMSNKQLNESAEDHEDALATCVSPQQLTKELNAELHRQEHDGKTRVSRGKKKAIMHQDQLMDLINRDGLEGDYDVYMLDKPETTKSGKVKKIKNKNGKLVPKPGNVNYNRIIGTFNKETGFIPNDTTHGKNFKPTKRPPKNSAIGKQGELDVEKFKELITTPPDKIFDQNPKMERGDEGRKQLTVNTGLPAISAIVYDESEDTFKYVNTCPGAGECALVCYARKGFYGMNDGKIMKLIRRLNLLWNEPKMYYNMVMNELTSFASALQKPTPKGGWDMDDLTTEFDNHGDQLVIRWNDAGDFFSDMYFKIAIQATKQLKGMGYNVKSYAYTKKGKYLDLAGDDMVMNFSKGAMKKEVESVDIEKVKYSDMVPREVFKDMFVYDGPHVVKTEDGLPQFKEGGKEILRQAIANKYDIPAERLKYQNELPNEEGEKFQYDSIVLQTGDTDISAQRNDVQKTFLLLH